MLTLNPLSPSSVWEHLATGFRFEASSRLAGWMSQVLEGKPSNLDNPERAQPHIMKQDHPILESETLNPEPETQVLDAPQSIKTRGHEPKNLNQPGLLSHSLPGCSWWREAQLGGICNCQKATIPRVQQPRRWAFLFRSSPVYAWYALFCQEPV